MSLSSFNIIQIFDLAALYTTIPHSKLKDRLKEFCFMNKNDQLKYKYLVLGRDTFKFLTDFPLYSHEAKIKTWASQGKRTEATPGL
jgi:hypothetical protein